MIQGYLSDKNFKKLAKSVWEKLPLDFGPTDIWIIDQEMLKLNEEADNGSRNDFGKARNLLLKILKKRLDSGVSDELIEKYNIKKCNSWKIIDFSEIDSQIAPNGPEESVFYTLVCVVVKILRDSRFLKDFAANSDAAVEFHKYVMGTDTKKPADDEPPKKLWAQSYIGVRREEELLK